MSDTGASTEGRSGLFRRLYDGETTFRFVPRWRLWFAISGTVIVIGLVSLGWRGLNLGIEFEGGTQWDLPAGDASVADAREALASIGLPEATVVRLRDQQNGTERLRIQAESSEVEESEARQALAEAAGIESNEVSVQQVGPSWGEQVSNSAEKALFFFLIAIALYITLRFEWKMAVATMVALFHDLLVTIGVYSLSGLPVTPATVVAILTILGFSIYDGIVVFDKVDENAQRLSLSGTRTYSDMVDESMNEVLMRTLNTSITALLPILSLLLVGTFLLGATTLREFGLALFIGLASGAYSSIFVASPTLALLKEREPRYTSLRDRIASGRSPLVATGGGAAALATGADAGPAGPLSPERGTAPGDGRPPIIEPRARRQRRR